MKTFSFKKGPSLSSHFITSETKILQIKLTLSDHFSACIEGPSSQALIDQIYQWLLHYQKHHPLPDLPLNLSNITPFRKKVLLQLQQTSTGETLSYKKLAQSSHSPNASRAVGSACKHNPFPLVLPCHRVIRGNGQLGEYNGGVEIKKRLLLFEKAVF